MKINYFYGSIAVKQGNGYAESLEFNVTESKGLTFRYPYGDATPEEAEAVSKFVKLITDAYNVLTNQIDKTNKDLKLEQYAPKVSAEETTEVSAVTQPSHGTCSNNQADTDLVAHSEAEQERLDMEEELREETFRGAVTMDEAKTPEQMLEAMIASGERKEVRDLPM